MQCVSDLTKLRDAVAARSRRLRNVVSEVSMPLGSADKRAMAFVSIELDNLVVVSLRQYTKSSLLRSRTSNGTRIAASVLPKSEQEAAALVFKALNPKGYAKKKNPFKISEKDEVAFRDPKDAEKVLTTYSATNLPSLILALSLNAEVFSEAKICRHFFAHRARNTFRAVEALAASMGILSIDSPEHLMLRGRPGSGVRLVDGWLSDLENFFDLAA